MPTYRYKAVAASGELLEAEIEEPSRAAVIERLNGQGHLPIRVEETAQDSLSGWLHKDLFGTRGASRRQLTLVTRELATLLQAGLALDRSLEIVIGLTGNQRVKDLLRGILERLRGGSSLADAMAAEGGGFPPYTVSMVQAGEAGGSLDLVLARVADHMERTQRVMEELKSAMIYPSILVATVAVSIVVLLSYVIPQFEPLFADADEALPLATRIVIGAAAAIERFWWLAVLVLLAGWLLLRFQLRKPAFRVRWDGWLLRVPRLGPLLVMIDVARLARTLGTLLANGVAMPTAISVAKGTLRNAAMTAAIGEVEAAVKEGRGLSQPLTETGLLPELATTLIGIGEQAANLDAMLIRLGDIYEEETQRAIQRLMAVLVPALTIGLGLLIAAIIASILVAILSVNELAF